MARAKRSNSVAQVALIAAGQLRLEKLGDAVKARRLFRLAYRLAPTSALSLEALKGLAGCHRQTGAAKAERNVLRKLAVGYGETATARWAETRLNALADEASTPAQ